MAKSAPLSEGTVILAEEQYAGRGQANNSWVSQPGKNLTFSLLLTPSFISPENQFVLNQAVCVGINDVLDEIIGQGLKIKWPNDIYVNNEKLGGILIENIIQGSAWKYAIIGIGLNINQSDFPETLKNVTSLRKILQHDYNRDTLLAEICKQIEIRYLQLKAGKTDQIVAAYHQNLYRYRELARFVVEGEQKQGEIVGVDQHGFLQVSLDGEIRGFGFKEIAFVIA